MSDEQIRYVGDTYPPLVFDGPMAGCEVFYEFVPDSRRAKRHGGPLRAIDAERGVFVAPAPRAAGVAQITVHFPNGWRVTSPTILRWVRR